MVCRLRCGYYLRVSRSNTTGLYAPLRTDVLEHQFRALVECSADAIFITDFDSARFQHANAKALELFGYTEAELCVMTGRQLHPADDYALVDEISRELIETGAVTRDAVRLKRADGTLFWAELRSSVYDVQGRGLYVTFVRDISARLEHERELSAANQTLKSMETQLIRSSRLAAIGQIAAGVAHEVNNPAASALLNLRMLCSDLERMAGFVGAGASHAASTPELERFLLEARAAARDSVDAVERIASVVRGLSRFARIDEEEVRCTSANEAVSAALRLVQHQLNHVANVRCELGSTRELNGDFGKLTQVFVNLLTNAGQAIEQGGGSSIVVTTADTRSGVRVIVDDDGPGVPAEIAGHIFEPFFTTKSAEQGTGLGLPLCADIVHQHRGRLELRPKDGRGARFVLTIPFQTGLSTRPPAPPEPAAPGGRILVVDDDEVLVRAYRRWLGRKHEVVVAGNGDDALQLLKDDAEFDVVLCDLMMPGCDGVALHEALGRSYPQLLERVVFCSGGPTTTRCREFLQRPGIVFFEKPIRQELLDECLSRLIRKRAATKLSS
jgi:PAS domain S-box-containing protein